MYKSLNCEGISILFSFGFAALLSAVTSKSSQIKPAESRRHECGSTTVNSYTTQAAWTLQNSLIKCRSGVSTERAPWHVPLGCARRMENSMHLCGCLMDVTVC